MYVLFYLPSTGYFSFLQISWQISNSPLSVSGMLADAVLSVEDLLNTCLQTITYGNGVCDGENYFLITCQDSGESATGKYCQCCCSPRLDSQSFPNFFFLNLHL